LARVALQVERARDVEDEVRKRLRPLALQATAAERAEKLRFETAAIEARIAELDLAGASSKRADAESRRDAAALVRRGAQGRLEGLPPAARALAEGGARLALSQLEVEPGAERAVAAALGSRAAAVVVDDPQAGLDLLQQARGRGLGSLSVLAGRDPGEVVRAFPVVPVEALLEATVPSVTEEGFGYDPGRGELWFAGETAEAVLLELDARRRELRDEVAALSARAVEAATHAERAGERAKTAAAAFAPVAHVRNARRAEPGQLERLAAGARPRATPRGSGAARKLARARGGAVRDAGARARGGAGGAHRRARRDAPPARRRRARAATARGSGGRAVGRDRCRAGAHRRG